MEPSALISLLSKPAIEKSAPIFKSLKDSVGHYLNDGLLDYFLVSLNKYREIKTLLHRQPTNFYNIYYPTKLNLNGEIFETISIKDIFKKGNFITILGDAGSGKSTLVKHLFINSFIESYKAPIFVALRDLDKDTFNPEQYLRNIILEKKLSPSDNFLTKLLNNGEFVFFLDGFDEINSKNKKLITSELEKFIDKYPNNSYILTSRPYSNIEYFSNFYNYSISDLTFDDREKFIKKQILDVKLADKIIDSIKDNNHSKYIEDFLKNSLLLTLYIMSYSKNSSIPNSKYIFYRRVFDVLYAEHDSATKIGFEREIKTQLNQESLEEILKFFSYLSFFDNAFDFNKDYINLKLNLIKDKNLQLKFNNNNFIEDMKLSIGLWVEDSGLYSFSHRSMQEYFASLFISRLKDEKNKQKVYNKIITIVSTSYEFNLENFLELCYEMDSNSFIKFYLVPVLNKFKLLFLNTDGSYNYNLSFMNEGFYDGSISITKDLMFCVETYLVLYKKFDFIFKEFIPIFIENQSHPNFKKFIKSESFKNKQEGKLYLSHDITPEYINFLDEIGIKNCIEKNILYINNILEELNQRLNDENNNENEIIDLI